MSCDHQATMLPCPKHKQTILTLDANDICENSIDNIKHKQSRIFQVLCVASRHNCVESTDSVLPA